MASIPGQTDTAPLGGGATASLPLDRRTQLFKDMALSAIERLQAELGLSPSQVRMDFFIDENNAVTVGINLFTDEPHDLGLIQRMATEIVAAVGAANSIDFGSPTLLEALRNPDDINRDFLVRFAIDLANLLPQSGLTFGEGGEDDVTIRLDTTAGVTVVIHNKTSKADDTRETIERIVRENIDRHAFSTGVTLSAEKVSVVQGTPTDEVDLSAFEVAATPVTVPTAISPPALAPTLDESLEQVRASVEQALLRVGITASISVDPNGTISIQTGVRPDQDTATIRGVVTATVDPVIRQFPADFNLRLSIGFVSAEPVVAPPEPPAPPPAPDVEPSAGLAVIVAADEIQRLIAFLKSDDVEIRKAAAQSLADLNKAAAAAVPALIEALSDVDKGVREIAAAALGRTRSNPNEVVPALMGALDDEEATVRNSAAFALGLFGAQAEDASILLIQRLDDPALIVRQEAARALGRIAVPTDLIIESLMRKLRDFDDFQMGSAVRVALGNVGAAAVPTLLAALSDPSSEVRRRAASALGAVGADAVSVVPKLIELLSDASATVRFDAAQALGNIGTPAATIVPALTALSNDPSENVREIAIVALGSVTNAAAQTVPLLIAALKSDDASVRRAAADSLGSMGESAISSIEDLRALLRDPDRDVEEAARAAISEIETSIGTGSPGSVGATGQVGLVIDFVPANGVESQLRQLITDTVERIRTSNTIEDVTTTLSANVEDFDAFKVFAQRVNVPGFFDDEVVVNSILNSARTPEGLDSVVTLVNSQIVDRIVANSMTSETPEDQVEAFATPESQADVIEAIEASARKFDVNAEITSDARGDVNILVNSDLQSRVGEIRMDVQESLSGLPQGMTTIFQIDLGDTSTPTDPSPEPTADQINVDGLTDVVANNINTPEFTVKQMETTIDLINAREAELEAAGQDLTIGAIKARGTLRINLFLNRPVNVANVISTLMESYPSVSTPVLQDSSTPFQLKVVAAINAAMTEPTLFSAEILKTTSLTERLRNGFSPEFSIIVDEVIVGLREGKTCAEMRAAIFRQLGPTLTAASEIGSADDIVVNGEALLAEIQPQQIAVAPPLPTTTTLTAEQIQNVTELIQERITAEGIDAKFKVDSSGIVSILAGVAPGADLIKLGLDLDAIVSGVNFIFQGQFTLSSSLSFTEESIVPLPVQTPPTTTELPDPSVLASVVTEVQNALASLTFEVTVTSDPSGLVNITAVAAAPGDTTSGALNAAQTQAAISAALRNAIGTLPTGVNVVSFVSVPVGPVPIVVTEANRGTLINDVQTQINEALAAAGFETTASVDVGGSIQTTTSLPSGAEPSVIRTNLAAVIDPVIAAFPEALNLTVSFGFVSASPATVVPESDPDVDIPVVPVSVDPEAGAPGETGDEGVPFVPGAVEIAALPTPPPPSPPPAPQQSPATISDVEVLIVTAPRQLSPTEQAVADSNSLNLLNSTVNQISGQISLNNLGIRSQEDAGEFLDPALLAANLRLTNLLKQIRPAGGLEVLRQGLTNSTEVTAEDLRSLTADQRVDLVNAANEAIDTDTPFADVAGGADLIASLLGEGIDPSTLLNLQVIIDGLVAGSTDGSIKSGQFEATTTTTPISILTTEEREVLESQIEMALGRSVGKANVTIAASGKVTVQYQSDFDGSQRLLARRLTTPIVRRVGGNNVTTVTIRFDAQLPAAPPPVSSLISNLEESITAALQEIDPAVAVAVSSSGQVTVTVAATNPASDQQLIDATNEVIENTAETTTGMDTTTTVVVNRVNVQALSEIASDGIEAVRRAFTTEGTNQPVSQQPAKTTDAEAAKEASEAFINAPITPDECPPGPVSNPGAF